MSTPTNSNIRVGFTEDHGMCAEQAEFPPKGTEYTFPTATRFGSKVFQSPIKGYMSTFDLSECEIVESVISPIQTNLPWVYSLACFQEALAFSFFGLPSPRFLRIKYMEYLFHKDNCKKLVFWSQAGKDTLTTYGNITNQKVWDKSAVVYPAIRAADDALIRFNEEKVTLLFSGDFFRKGGANVIDAFEKAQKLYPNISMYVCCDEKIDFNTSDQALRNKYLTKIKENKAIIFGRVPRDKMLNEILPVTDIYLLPTYTEAFGFAVLEAMAFGIPVISTNHMAIPEIIEEGECGYMIDTERFNTEEMFKGYVVDEIPEEFHQFVSDELFQKLCTLIDSPSLRKQMGQSGVEITRSKFSFDTRNKQMQKIYEEAMS